MSDTAAFFANKKKKKKAFKFNANLVDAESVTPTVHVDAPAMSIEHDPVSTATAAIDVMAVVDENKPEDDEQWDDEALAASSVRKTGGGAAEVLDMKSLEKGQNDNIAEKLRVEETKAQLAAAREGMEREAAKLKEQQEEQEQKKKEAPVSSRFGAAAAGMATGGKWVPPHMRGGGTTAPARRGWGAGATSQKLDVQDEELFPDLAAADKILEKKEKDHQPVFKVPKKTPVGGGATWASKPKAAPQAPATAPEPEPEPVPTTSVPSPADESKPSAVASKVTPKKKKKKDLSTFKPKA